MDIETLKATQTPIKEQYRIDAQSALVTLRSKGIVVPNEQQCIVTSFAGEVRAGLHPAAGGSDRDAC
ncbi:MAG: OsmC family peroxiredoxin, partial [bacterium]